MKHYYITNPNFPKGFEEVTEEEWNTIVGNEEVRPYVHKVYRGEFPIEEVPTELQESVQSVVDAKIARFGVYAEQEISATELKDKIKSII